MNRSVRHSRFGMVVKGFLLFYILTFLPMSMMAQPQRRRTQQQAESQQNKSNANTITTRAQISFPTQASMSEDVVWRRDIYREIVLTEDANAGLYYPTEPVGTQMNLFTYMFRLIMRGMVKAYEYRMDGNEVFTDSARIKPLQFLDDYHIYYERTNRGVHLDDSDIPSKEVTAYYLKESAYYDQATSTFHTKVLALCPIMVREDDFGDGAAKYPLFWVKYDDMAPFLAKQTIMTSNLNNAATMSVDDFFAMNKYRGKIYKTTNMLGQTLAQYCNNDSSAMSKEQRRIEAELKEFEKHIWGDPQKRDSLDSIANAQANVKTKKERKANRRSGDNSETTVKKSSSKSKKSSPSSSAARVTVRRERH